MDFINSFFVLRPQSGRLFFKHKPRKTPKCGRILAIAPLKFKWANLSLKIKANLARLTLRRNKALAMRHLLKVVDEKGNLFIYLFLRS
jgi:hypothetical protein